MKNIIIKGAPGSPYTRKMLSICRYRRIPYEFIISGLDGKGIMPTNHLPSAKIQLLPTVYFNKRKGKLDPLIDSTFILRKLETIYKTRSIIPTNPVLNFLNYILEDFADEWLTKATFHYRWTYKKDIEKAGSTLSRWTSLTDTDDQILSIKKNIINRQVSRLKVVGSNNTTAKIIENSYIRVLRLMCNHMNNYPYIFGERPSSSDFAIFGQFSQLVLFDPTSMAIADRIASRVVAWTGIMEDMSGMQVSDKDWIKNINNNFSLKKIFCEVGKVYAPILLANAEAINKGKSEVICFIDNKRWRQDPFAYQLKCLNWIREEYKKMSKDSKIKVDSFLEGSGCEVLLK